MPILEELPTDPHQGHQASSKGLSVAQHVVFMLAICGIQLGLVEAGGSIRRLVTRANSPSWRPWGAFRFAENAASNSLLDHSETVGICSE